MIIPVTQTHVYLCTENKTRDIIVAICDYKVCVVGKELTKLNSFHHPNLFLLTSECELFLSLIDPVDLSQLCCVVSSFSPPLWQDLVLSHGRDEHHDHHAAVLCQAHRQRLRPQLLRPAHPLLSVCGDEEVR